MSKVPIIKRISFQFDKGEVIFYKKVNNPPYYAYVYDDTGNRIGSFEMRGRQAANITRASKLLRDTLKKLNGKGQGAL